MSENKNSMVSATMNYAIPLGLFWIVKYLFIIGGDYAEVSKYISNLLGIGSPLIAYILLCRYRDKDLAGNITYKKSIGFMLLLFGFASLFETILTSLHFLVINPGMVTRLNNEAYTMLSKMNLPAIYAGQLETIHSYGALYYIMSIIFQNIIIGLFLGLVLGYFVSRPQNTPHQNI